VGWLELPRPAVELWAALIDGFVSTAAMGAGAWCAIRLAQAWPDSGRE